MTKKSSGFTLVELSVVLVIIGLLAAGILVGKDLIQAAKVRQQVSQIEKYNTAINTFRTKYNGLPGDLLATEAAATGLVARSGGPGHGDGNGILEHCIPGPNMGMPTGCEIALFWSDLSAAGLIDGSFTAATDAPLSYTDFSQTLAYFPKTKLIDNATLIPSTDYETYQLWFVTLQLQDNSGVGSLYTWQMLYPEPAYMVDAKMDDGKPLSGTVMAMESGGGPAQNTAGLFFIPPSQANNRCVLLSGEYNITYHDFPRCQLNFKAVY